MDEIIGSALDDGPRRRAYRGVSDRPDAALISKKEY
jgi:hypothetical protein